MFKLNLILIIATSANSFASRHHDLPCDQRTSCLSFPNLSNLWVSWCTLMTSLSTGRLVPVQARSSTWPLHDSLNGATCRLRSIVVTQAPSQLSGKGGPSSTSKIIDDMYLFQDWRRRG